MRYQSSRLHECQGDVFKEWIINAADFISRKTEQSNCCTDYLKWLLKKVGIA